MNAVAARKMEPSPARSAVEIARELGPVFAGRAEAADEDKYVAQNMAELKASGLVEAGVPQELGGGGASIEELAAMLRTLGYHCGSTALTFSMHTHQVAIPAWRWVHQQPAKAAVEPLLKRIAAERIMLLSSGGSDWIGGSGKAEKIEGGYRITARKVFTSGAPTGDILMTGAVLEEPGQPPMVLHFGVPMNSPHVKVLDTWRTLGMRGTGSHDVMIDGHVVPDAGVALKRKAGEWHLLFQIISTIAFSLVYGVYLGIAESARESGDRHREKEEAGPARDRSCGPHGDRVARGAAGSRVDAGCRAPQHAIARSGQRRDDRTAARGPSRHRIRRACHGAGGRRRVLSFGWLGAEIPRHPGRPVSPAAERTAGGICRRHGVRPSGGTDFLSTAILAVRASSTRAALDRYA